MKLNEAVSRRLGELLQKQGMTQYQLSSSVTLHPNCAAALGNRTRLGGLTQFYNPPCMAAPCCPPFAQGGLRSASAVILRCRTRQVV